MAMARGANGILASTLCVDDVDLGATWSSNKGRIVHREAQHMLMPHASSVRNSGGRCGPRVWGGHVTEGGLSHSHLVA